MTCQRFDQIQNQEHNRHSFIPTDPRLLIAAFGLIIVFAMISRDIRGLLVVLIYISILCATAKFSAGTIVKHIKTITPFALLILLINAFLVEGEPVFSIIPVVSRMGLITGAYYGVRLLVMYLAMVLFLTVTTPEDIAKAIAAVIRPISPDIAKRVALHAFVSLGYLPLFAREIDRIRTAQRFRGGGMDGGLAKKLNGVRLLIVPVILSAVQRSSQLAMVVELRGIRSTIAPLLVLEPVRPKDYVFLVVTIGVLAAGLWLA